MSSCPLLAEGPEEKRDGGAGALLIDTLSHSVLKVDGPVCPGSLQPSIVHAGISGRSLSFPRIILRLCLKGIAFIQGDGLTNLFRPVSRFDLSKGRLARLAHPVGRPDRETTTEFSMSSLITS
jgi:hypothetical protein